MSNTKTSGQEFEVTIHTSPGPTCGTFSLLWLTLIGSDSETPPINMNDCERHLLPGSTCRVRVWPKCSVGRLVLVRLRLEVRTGFPNLDWHCNRVVVRESDGPVQLFLCERWLRPGEGDVELRHAKFCLMKDETEEKLKQQRIRHLQGQQALIRWRPFITGTPYCIDLDSLSELGPNLNYFHKTPANNLHYLKGFVSRAEPWSSFSELEVLFAHIGHKNTIARFVKAHWTDDWYFGHQCLNGSNPLLLRQTCILPANLSVTSEMLRPFLPGDSSLEQELQKGTIYLLDYDILDGLPGNVINRKQTYLSAPLCLLHLNQQGQLVPIAIQLQQMPGSLNPVFLPSDTSCDWLLAKIWVRCADFQFHQLVSHYLRTHVMGELLCVATLRHLPELHPLHQLLMPHVRTSLQINLKARATLLATGGVFDQAIGSGLNTLPVLLSRASARIRYRSLCVPDDLKDRGLDNLPQSYYGQDALRVWEVLHRFVLGWVDMYYSGDEDVQQDLELQLWISDINTHGFTPHSGFPAFFFTKAELSQFVTMVVFSCSALHAAVNFSQLDFALWMPNCPASMSRPPPQVKGTLTLSDIMSYLPDVNSTCRVLMALTVLSQPSVNFVPLCQYKESFFQDEPHCRLVVEVQAGLQAISDDITERNSQLDLPYPYLFPGRIENSVAI